MVIKLFTFGHGQLLAGQFWPFSDADWGIRLVNSHVLPANRPYNREHFLEVRSRLAVFTMNTPLSSLQNFISPPRAHEASISRWNQRPKSEILFCIWVMRAHDNFFVAYNVIYNFNYVIYNLKLKTVKTYCTVLSFSFIFRFHRSAYIIYASFFWSV